MKKSEINKLVQDYHTIKAKLGKSYNHKLFEKLQELEHRYYHETGNNIKNKNPDKSHLVQ